jgi:glutamate N-acetyltransferase/amino-acid N-acetyltransferase
MPLRVRQKVQTLPRSGGVVAVNLPPLGTLEPIKGIRIGTTCAGIKQTKRDDMVVLLLDAGVQVSGVFTQSAFKAAPVRICERHLAAGKPRAMVINSGNANAATGSAGMEDALQSCRWVAEGLGLRAEEVLPFSTGVIGQRLPLGKMGEGIAAACRQLGDRWNSAALAIMTTDTGPKALSRTVDLEGGVPVTITGMAKGAGMIRPDMATMLAYIGTDAAVSRDCLDALVRQAADASFNRITVDGDTSTNDSFIVIATGAAGNASIDSEDHPGYAPLREGITAVARELAQRIIRDGEGATKFVTVTVRGGRDAAECLQVAYTVAQSPLIKTAMFASDPNWGRFCMAIGRAGIVGLDADRVALYLDDVCVARGGMIAPEYTEQSGANVMAQDEFGVSIDLGRGAAAETVWTCDFSYEYVRINAEYRT